MEKLSGALLARAFLPSPEHVKEGLTFLDLGIKVQIILHELSTSLFWSSCGEIGLWGFSFFIFITDPREMAGIFWHLPHILRGLCGFLIVKKMPNSHDMVNAIDIPKTEKIPFSNISKYVINGAKTSAAKFEKETGKFLLAYFGLTVLCFILDFISFWVQVVAYGEEQTPFSDVALLFIACINLTIVLYYVAWVLSTLMKLPSYANSYVMLGLIGVISRITKALDAKLETAQVAQKEKYQSEQKVSKEEKARMYRQGK